MAGKPSAERLAALLTYQRSLLADRRRNQAFQRALAKRVRPGDAVVDIGSGSGIWAIAAARLGARRVVAIEREELLCALIERMARENGVADRVEVLCGDVLQLDLMREFDVAISEMVGTVGFDEGVVGLMAYARSHFVRPSGVLVPQQIGLRAAPAWVPDLAVADLETASFRELARQVPHWIAPGCLGTLARSQRLLDVDLRAADPARPLPLGRAEFELDDAAAVSGLGIWVELTLAPGIRLSTRSGTHWGAILLPIERLPAGPGRLRFDVDWNPQRRRWWFEHEGRDGTRTRAEHAPLFALGSLKLASAAAQSRTR